MAPKRRGRPRKTEKLAAVEDSEKKETLAPPENAVADAEEEEAEEEETQPSPKKAKVEEKKKRGRKPKAAPAKKAGKQKPPVEEDDEESAEDAKGLDLEEAQASAKSEKVVVIEASKECNCFKTRAAKVQAGLIKAIPGIAVRVNPEKPRKGCFEVRGEDGKIYLSLLGLPRPFTKLKKLDMDQTIEEIVAKLK